MKRFISLLVLSIVGIFFAGCLSEQKGNRQMAHEAAEQGFLPMIGHDFLGNVVIHGYFPIKEITQEDVKLFRECAEQGNADAQFCLGGCYFCGLGVEKDLREAVKWWRKSTEQGNADAQEALKQIDMHRPQ